jgi:hypothetical protein
MLLMGKLIISMAIFNSYLDITRGYQEIPETYSNFQDSSAAGGGNSIQDAPQTQRLKPNENCCSNQRHV